VAASGVESSCARVDDLVKEAQDAAESTQVVDSANRSDEQGAGTASNNVNANSSHRLRVVAAHDFMVVEATKTDWRIHEHMCPPLD